MGARGSNFTPSEDEFLRLHYLKRGARWCADRLPGRTQNSVWLRATRIKIARRREDIHLPTSDFIDAAIRRAYTGDRKVGFVKRLAQQVNRPGEWVARRALALGLIQSRERRDWTPEELAFASSRPLVNPRALSDQMRRRGWRRTPGAIAHLRSDGRLERVDSERFTAAGLAEAMGVSGNTVAQWIKRELLKAERRGWARTEAQHGDGYVIHERDVARFIVQHTAHISLAKIEPNKFWFIDLLARYGAPGSATGRQKLAERCAA